MYKLSKQSFMQSLYNSTSPYTVHYISRLFLFDVVHYILCNITPIIHSRPSDWIRDKLFPLKGNYNRVSNCFVAYIVWTKAKPINFLLGRPLYKWKQRKIHFVSMLMRFVQKEWHRRFQSTRFQQTYTYNLKQFFSLLEMQLEALRWLVP